MGPYIVVPKFMRSASGSAAAGADPGAAQAGRETEVAEQQRRTAGLERIESPGGGASVRLYAPSPRSRQHPDLARNPGAGSAGKPGKVSDSGEASPRATRSTALAGRETPREGHRRREFQAHPPRADARCGGSPT